MRRECRERFPRVRLQRKLLASDRGMHHGTCVTHVPWCMSRSLPAVGGETLPAHAHPQFYISGKRPIISRNHFCNKIYHIIWYLGMCKEFVKQCPPIPTLLCRRTLVTVHPVNSNYYLFAGAVTKRLVTTRSLNECIWAFTAHSVIIAGTVYNVNTCSCKKLHLPYWLTRNQTSVGTWPSRVHRAGTWLVT